MADKRHIELDEIKIKEIFDAKFKAGLAAKFDTKLTAAIKASSTLTTDPPKTKPPKGVGVLGTLTLKLKDKLLMGEISWAFTTWPDKPPAILGGGKSSGGTEVDPNKIGADDVDFVVDTLVKAFASKVIPALAALKI